MDNQRNSQQWKYFIPVFAVLITVAFSASMALAGNQGAVQGSNVAQGATGTATGACTVMNYASTDVPKPIGPNLGTVICVPLMIGMTLMACQYAILKR